MRSKLQSSLLASAACLGLLAGCGSVVTSDDGVDAAAAITISEVSPDHGPLIGGLEITVTGAGFSGAGDAFVLVEGVRADDVAVASDGELTFTLPPGVLQGDLVDVTVFNQNGFATAPDAIRYNEIPFVVGISPSIGRRAGGTTVTITGRGFELLEAGDATVTVAGVAATNVTVVDDTTITATTGAVATSVPAFTPVDVTVSNANGSATLEGAYKMSAQGLLAFERSGTNQIAYIDPATGYSTRIANNSQRLRGCALGSGGTIFAVGRDPTSGLHALYTVDPLTGVNTKIGDLMEGVTNRNVSSLAFVGSTLYGSAMQVPCCPAGAQPSRLYSINQSTGALTLVGAANYSTQRGQAISLRDGATVYHADRSNESLDSINVSTGAQVVGPTMSGAASTFNVHGIANIGGSVFLSGRVNPAPIYQVNTTTGVLTQIASLNQQVSGLCQTPASF